MSKEICLGVNRTGLRTYPHESRALPESLHEQPEPPQPAYNATDNRRYCREEADTVESMPPPTNLRGAAGAAEFSLMGQRLHTLLDKLGERAAFEQTGTRLYDAALTRLSDASLPKGMSLSGLQEIRNEEHSHFMLLTEAIESLGGDPTCQTFCSDLAAMQRMGLTRAINDPRATLPQVLETLLAVELIDATSWEFLIELASEVNQTELVIWMGAALITERRHVQRVRTWLFPFHGTVCPLDRDRIVEGAV